MTRIAVTMLNDPVITVDILCCMALASNTLSVTSCVELEAMEPSIGGAPVKMFAAIPAHNISFAVITGICRC